jgi:hypothetical protein
MGTWGEAERLVQPTDLTVRSVFVFCEHGGRKEDRCGSRFRHQGLVGLVKARLMRLMLTLSSVGMIALAGGASLKGF